MLLLVVQVGRSKVKETRQEATLAWLNFTLFDYQDQLRVGQNTVYMWPMRDDNVLSDEQLNPIGQLK